MTRLRKGDLMPGEKKRGKKLYNCLASEKVAEVKEESSRRERS